MTQDTLTTETIDTTPAHSVDTITTDTVDTTIATPSDTPSISFEDAERLAQRITALEYRVTMTEAAINQLRQSSPTPPNTPEDTATATAETTTEAPATAPTPDPTPTPEQLEVPYFSYREIEAELKDLAQDIVVRSEADFRPEVNPTGRIYRLPTDAAVIPPEQLERLIVPSKEWAAFARILNLYPCTVWRDPRDREGSNVDYIILMLHPEGLIFIRIRAVET